MCVCVCVPSNANERCCLEFKEQQGTPYLVSMPELAVLATPKGVRVTTFWKRVVAGREGAAEGTSSTRGAGAQNECKQQAGMEEW